MCVFARKPTRWTSSTKIRTTSTTTKSSLGSSSNSTTRTSSRTMSLITPQMGCTSSRLTFYWVAIEGTKDQAQNGNEITLTGSLTKNMLSCGSSASILATVDAETFRKCTLEGTCFVLSNSGQTLLLNLGNGDPQKPCFLKLPSNQWGLGSRDNALMPLVSAASNNLPFGTIIYMPRLQGLKVGSMIHNGCLRVDDVGWSLDKCHIDIFAGTYQLFKALFSSFPDSVSFQVKSVAECPLLDYKIALPSVTISRVSTTSTSTAR
jgi:hypothetical protein